MKRLGRAHRPFFRICATDKRTPRDGRVLEELGTYDPSVEDTDARAVLNKERIDYWLGVGAQPSEKVAVLIKKYGADGTHVAQQETALSKLAQPREVPPAGPAVSKPKQEEEPKQDEAAKQEEGSTQVKSAESEETKPAQSASSDEAAAETPPPAEAPPAAKVENEETTAEQDASTEQSDAPSEETKTAEA